jgi:hypothetical protein
MQTTERKFDGYVLGRTLGSGCSSKVKEGEYPDGKKIALKIFKKDNEGSLYLIKLCKKEKYGVGIFNERNIKYL